MKLPSSPLEQDTRLIKAMDAALMRTRHIDSSLALELQRFIEERYSLDSPKSVEPILHLLTTLGKIADLEKRATPASQISVLHQCAQDLQKYMEYFKEWANAYHFFYQIHGESLPYSFTGDSQEEFIQIVQFLFPGTWFPGPIEGKKTGNVNDGFTITLTSHPETQPERGGIPITQIPQSYTIFIPPKNIGETVLEYFKRIAEVQKRLCDQLMGNATIIKGAEFMELSKALREAGSKMDALTTTMHQYPLTHLNSAVDIPSITAAVNDILAQLGSIIKPADQWPKR